MRKPLLLTLLVSLVASAAVAGEYTFVFLRRPANAPQLDAATSATVQEGHMANIRRLAEEGHLAAAGPFGDDGVLRGIFVYTTGTKADAEAWLASDPAVKAGRLVGDLHVMTLPDGTFAKIDPAAKFVPEQYAMVIAPATVSADALAKAIADSREHGTLAFAATFHDGGGVLILTSTVDEAKPLATSLGGEVHPWFTQKGVLAK